MRDMDFGMESQIGPWRLISDVNQEERSLRTELWRAEDNPDMILESRLIGGEPVWEIGESLAPGVPLYTGVRHWQLVNALMEDPLPAQASNADVNAYCDGVWDAPLPDEPQASSETVWNWTQTRSMVSTPDPDGSLEVWTTWNPADPQARVLVQRTDTDPPTVLWDTTLPPTIAPAEHVVMAQALRAVEPDAYDQVAARCQAAAIFSRPPDDPVPTDQAYVQYQATPLPEWGPFQLETAQAVHQPAVLTCLRTDVPPDEAVVWQHVWPTPAADEADEALWLHHETVQAVRDASRQYALPEALPARANGLAAVLADYHEGTPVPPDVLSAHLRNDQAVVDLPGLKARLIAERPRHADPVQDWTLLLVKARTDKSQPEPGDPPGRVWRTTDKQSPLFAKQIPPEQIRETFVRARDTLQALEHDPVWFPPNQFVWSHQQLAAKICQAACAGPVIPQPPAGQPDQGWRYSYSPEQGLYYLWNETPDHTVQGVATRPLPQPVPGLPKQVAPISWVSPLTLVQEAAGRDTPIYPQGAPRVPPGVVAFDQRVDQALQAAADAWERNLRQPGPDPQAAQPSHPVSGVGLKL